MGNEGDAERYIEFIDSREKLFDVLKKIDNEIKESPCNENLSVDLLDDEASLLIRDIINQNQIFIDRADNIFEDIKSKIKEVKSTRDINMYYNFDNAASSGMLFDKKK